MKVTYCFNKAFEVENPGDWFARSVLMVSGRKITALTASALFGFFDLKFPPRTLAPCKKGIFTKDSK